MRGYDCDCVSGCMMKVEPLLRERGGGWRRRGGKGERKEMWARKEIWARKDRRMVG